MSDSRPDEDASKVREDADARMEGLKLVRESLKRRSSLVRAGPVLVQQSLPPHPVLPTPVRRVATVQLAPEVRLRALPLMMERQR